MRVRPLLAVALVAFAAGCVEPEPDDGFGPATGSPTSSPRSAPPGGGNPGFAPQQGHAEGSNHSIELDVAWRACEEGFCANATATNNGTSAVHVSSICVSPWSDRMARDGEEVQPHEDQAVCLAYGRAPFEPGAQMWHDFTWDGRLWKDGQASPAPAGSYTWTLVFIYDLDQQGTQAETTADVHLLVGVPT